MEMQSGSMSDEELLGSIEEFKNESHQMDVMSGSEESQNNLEAEVLQNIPSV
jgi:cell fate (sporulation/competence/biofilm development) regulator YlbF (YheA/YmcA/DUF963 family)